MYKKEVQILVRIKMPDKEEFMPFQAARKLNMIFLHSEVLRNDKSLQEKIINWGLEMLSEARVDWSDMHKTVLDAVITCDRKKEAIKRGQARDKKYAPFREYFKNLQHQKFIEYKKQGKKMSANGFVTWFLENIPNDVIIPYKESNQYHKLVGLAEENNRGFRKKHP
ncbi:MAG: hypothetical protein IJ184_00415 [Alphaproteobacteria bacterium]|nr:hypothetical protein [Alphaproteobacteria bacterium]